MLSATVMPIRRFVSYVADPAWGVTRTFGKSANDGAGPGSCSCASVAYPISWPDCNVFSRASFLMIPQREVLTRIASSRIILNSLAPIRLVVDAVSGATRARARCSGPRSTSAAPRPSSAPCARHANSLLDVTHQLVAVLGRPVRDAHHLPHAAIATHAHALDNTLLVHVKAPVVRAFAPNAPYSSPYRARLGALGVVIHPTAYKLPRFDRFPTSAPA